MLDVTRRVQLLHGRLFRVLPEWQSRLAALGIAQDQDWMNLSVGALVSRSPSTRCFRIALQGGESVYFKRYVYAPRKLLEFWLRPSKATVEAFGFTRLHRLGIPTLEVLAFGEVRFFGMLRGAFLVTRGIPHSQGMDRFAEKVWHRMSASERDRVYEELSGKLVEQVRRAHAARFFHHDLKWRNILIQSDEQGGYTPIWIDCPRARIQRLRWRRGVMVDLSGLGRLALSYCTLRQRYGFLRRYLGIEAHKEEVKRLYRRIQAHQARRPVRLLSPTPRN